MGINPTQPNFKSFTFDGENSRDYGVYITGEGVFNAPERNVEMVEIAGRNGAYVLDKGNFLNIEVTYPASIACDNETDFADAVSDLRNLLCSKVGYVRLEDDYNPNEYRLAIYKSGLEVDHDMLIGGEFDLVFECKPQRYLKSGETAISITSGDTITNPTRFDAKPELQAWGYGKFSINDANLEIVSRAIGKIKIAEDNMSYTGTVSTTFPTQYANSGNRIFGYLSSSPLVDRTCTAAFYFTINCGEDSIKSVNATSLSGWGTQVNDYGTNTVWVTLYYGSSEGYGTPSTDSHASIITVTLTDDSTKTFTLTGTSTYDGNDTITATQTVGALPTGYTLENQMVRVCELWLDSTQSALGSPIYIDLETGEAYKIENGSVASVNNAVVIPAELPTLPPGANTFTYDNTITQFKVAPRWWKV